MELTNIVNTLLSYASILAMVMFALVFTTNIIVEVIKGLFPKLPTNILVVIVAVLLTLLALFILAAVMEITVMWYYAVGAVVLGIFTAYAAMHGFDKFKEALQKLQDYSSTP